MKGGFVFLASFILVILLALCYATFSSEEKSVQTRDTKPLREFVDLGLSVKWATCNIGAKMPEHVGDYFAWGETSKKDYYHWSNYKFCNFDEERYKYYEQRSELGLWWNYIKFKKYCTNLAFGEGDDKVVLDENDDVAHTSWGDIWRMPTVEELLELKDSCNWTWVETRTVKGYKVTGKKKGYTNNSIFLPVSGYRDKERYREIYTEGCYSSKNLNHYYDYMYESALAIRFTKSEVNLSTQKRCEGFVVRAVCP